VLGIDAINDHDYVFAPMNPTNSTNPINPTNLAVQRLPTHDSLPTTYHQLRTTENGPIQIGDLLVSSSTPGVAMKGSDREDCVGAVVGKALEPLEEGEGTIVVQVMLR